MGHRLRVTGTLSRPVEALRLQGVVGQAIHDRVGAAGRRERGVLRARNRVGAAANEDAEARRAHGYL